MGRVRQRKVDMSGTLSVHTVSMTRLHSLINSCISPNWFFMQLAAAHFAGMTLERKIWRVMPPLSMSRTAAGIVC
jgi:hypothetical protein